MALGLLFLAVSDHNLQLVVKSSLIEFSDIYMPTLQSVNL